ncbi:MAG: Rne/Rng family ribonuclease [Pseudolabrys sp.]|nr:Rne/Rng family ribonuclease [Pseudolabrys sp.]MDP2295274.1 Rne/Rng family ribonuclease [Pseudolabrys sp.]
MADKMLIDATHPEETRVVVLRGNRVEEFDFESANRKQLRGNIYLAKVTRVEPSLQAAFVDYGGNRHGFLAFAEIHPDYYQIPVADRQALIVQEERDARAADADADNRASRGGRSGGRNRHRRSGSDRPRDPARSEAVAADAADTVPNDQPQQDMTPGEGALGGLPADQPEVTAQPYSDETPQIAAQTQPETQPDDQESAHETAAEIAEAAAPIATVDPDAADEAREAYEAPAGDIELPPEHLAEEAAARARSLADDEHDAENGETSPAIAPNGDDNHDDEHHEDEHVESVGGADALEEAQERTPRFRRNYKIQEVIKRRQVMLVQVVKEERGSKGAALTTYLSLAGRYSVLMPNTARGGGISRKITSGEDRSRLKEIAQELEVPEGMGVILRTAGASRTKTEVKRDFEYLLRLWETVRDLTLKSMAPKLVYEEGSLTKRSIRDLYSKDIEEIIVAGEAGYKEARDFMRMLMPSHAKNVKLYNDAQPLFTRYGIETQLDAMFQPTVQLRSGGYIVINQTEALVAIDVNSGRATREHHIEDTALKTNCEAADEVARQLRLRDLAGLVVIDFIDMDEGRNNRMVERRMKDALKHDRARIQVGRISHFGLLEMSRQRIRTSVLESSTEKCPTCGGLGHVRSVSSVALQLLRAIEDTLNKGATHNLIVRTRSEVALYVLNHKRAHLRALEERFHITITISADTTVSAQVSYIVERGEQMHTADAAKAIVAAAPPMPVLFEEDDFVEPEQEAEDDGEEMMSAPSSIEVVENDNGDEAEAGGDSEGEGADRDGGPRRKRRRGRGRGRGEGREGSGREGSPREGSPREPRESVARADNTAEHAVAHEDHDGGSPEEDGGERPQRAEGAQGVQGAVGAEGENGDVRRRRRRGRRGGRRNRHRDGETPGQANGNDHGNGNGGSEAGFAPEGGEPAYAPHNDQDDSQDHPVSAPLSAAPAEERVPAPEPVRPVTETPAAAQEAPRRRSTIREPAPFLAAGAAPAAPVILPTPVVVSTAADEPAPPKRGWWGKRLLGDK